jgi:hypothetical protein
MFQLEYFLSENIYLSPVLLYPTQMIEKNILPLSYPKKNVHV